MRTKIQFCAMDLNEDPLFYSKGKESKVRAKKAMGFLCVTSMDRLFLLFGSCFFGGCLFRGGFLGSGFLCRFLRRSFFNSRCFCSLLGCFPGFGRRFGGGFCCCLSRRSATKPSSSLGCVGSK